MTVDAILSRELKSLHEELSAPERLSPPTHRTSVSGGAAARARQLQDTAEEQQLRGALSRFVDATTEFVKEAKKNVSAHPAVIVMGAMAVGIFIGRLRR